ncbi:MAG: 3'-5' exoribonuclease YhaM family protein [Leptospirales bacterium]
MKIVKGVAFVKSKSVQEGKNGPALFMDLVFRGTQPNLPLQEYPARLWEGVDRVATMIQTGELLYAEGQEIVFNGETQLRLTKISPLKATPEEVFAFIPKSVVPVTEGMGKLKEYLESLEDPMLKEFGLMMLADPEIRDRFPLAPAAKKNHHAFVGGLLEHTLEILEMGDRIAPVLGLNRDLLLLGLFLHDIGKCWEISSTPGFSYTDEGRLVGHMYLGCEKVAQISRRVEGFPERYLRVLQHFILSHHGEFAYGSPILPATPEAMAVHFLDNLSGQVNAIRRVRPQDGDQWGYEKNRGAYIWKKGSDPSSWSQTPVGKGERKVFEP